MNLWTNRNSLSDFIQNALYGSLNQSTNLYFAVAFFTDAKTVLNLIEDGAHLRMVVRLGFPTNPASLRKLVALNNVEIRYYTGSAFHPKLYIFGNKVALVGSANLTNSALLANQEIVTSIESDDPRFSELQALFSEYWQEASVLTVEALDAYERSYNKYKKAISEVEDIDKETESAVGKTVFPNIDRGERKKSKESIFLDTYQKTYQECVTAFNKIRAVYESLGLRKNENNAVPLRIEVDSFLSFVKERKAVSETWADTEIGWDQSKINLVRQHAEEWLETDWYHFDHRICQINYPLITRVLGSANSIADASYDDILESFIVLHSFHDRLRFFKGGLSTLVERFRQENDLSKVKASITHLLYGSEDTVKRMADLIFQPEYKLSNFGQSNVQELVGWINNEELPVVNGRTTKVFRYYGFEVQQL